MTHDRADGDNAAVLSDDVIRDPNRDELDRAGFAKALAHAILTMDVESPFVFSIEGEWGSGKSTVLEFAKYYLTHRADIGAKVPLETDPIIIEFSPWWFSGSEDLLRQFVREISLQLRGNRKVLEPLQKLPDLLDGLGAALTPLVSVMPHGAEAGIFVRIMTAVTRWFVGTKDVASLRREIEQTLRAQADRIVVFLDDIDRLQPQELLQVCKVVKAIANLPRLIYVLGFDREAVTKGLAKANVHDPDQYIEKIVQSVWTLPSPDKLGIARLTGNMITQLLADTPPDLWQNDRWQSLYFDGLKELIRTPRDVKRVANALRPSYPPVRSEVNAVDFIGFHALRVLVPLAYAFIVANHGWLTNSDVHFFRDEDDERKDHNRRIDVMLSSLPEWQRGAVDKMLETMFPLFERGVKPSRFPDSFYTQWRRECRVCSPGRFDFYARLSIPTGAISTGELNRILKPVSTEALRLDLQRLAGEQAYDGHSKLKKFLEYAAASVAGTLSGGERQELLGQIFRVADDFISKLEITSLPFYSSDWQFARLVNAVIGLVPKGTDRLTSATEAWKGGAAVSLMVRCWYFWKELLEHYEAGSLGAITYFNQGELDDLRGALLHRIEVLAEKGSLAKTPLLDFVLYFWDEQGSGAGSQYASGLSSTEEGLADLAVGALCQATKPVYRSDAAQLERWTATTRQDLLKRCEDLLAQRREWLEEIHTIALKTFIDEVRNPRDKWGRPVRTDSTTS